MRSKHTLMSTENTQVFHILVTEETNPTSDNPLTIERLSLRVSEDPSKDIMRLLSTEKRKTRDDKGSKKPEGGAK